MSHNSIRRFFLCLPLAFAGCLLGAGCEEFDNEGDMSDDELNGRLRETAQAAGAAAAETADTGTASSATSPAEAATRSESAAQPVEERNAIAEIYNTATEIGAISWKGKNVSSWPVTATLRASVSGGTVKLDYDKARVWPEVDGVCANPWAIVNIGGRWYAATFEYLRPGQKSKPSYTLDGSHGDHFKTEPLSSWRPQSGEVFGLMVSGLCRGGLSNVKERSNICIVRWP